jgi:hypothetical protein
MVGAGALSRKKLRYTPIREVVTATPTAVTSIPETPGEKKGDRRRRDQHGDGQDDARGGERAHHRQREQAQQPVVEHAAPAVPARAPAPDQRRAAGGRASGARSPALTTTAMTPLWSRSPGPRPACCRTGCGRGARRSRCRVEHDAQREHAGEDHAQERVLLDAAVLLQPARASAQAIRRRRRPAPAARRDIGLHHARQAPRGSTASPISDQALEQPGKQDSSADRTAGQDGRWQRLLHEGKGERRQAGLHQTPHGGGRRRAAGPRGGRCLGASTKAVWKMRVCSRR